MRANTEKFWFNRRMSGEKLASRGAGPHSVYRRESWVLGEGRGYKKH